jgi:2-oxoglutarate ferredoxin oxidoreductase subunit beta
MPIKVPEMIAGNFQTAYVARGTVTDAKHIRELKGYVRNALKA